MTAHILAYVRAWTLTVSS